MFHDTTTNPAASAADTLTRGQAVALEIRRRVLSGGYAPGFHMNEAEISSSFGVSRTPIRAALTKLAAEGLLVYTPNIGYVVRYFSRDDVAHVYEVRSVLFGLAAQLAAAQGFNAQLQLEASELISSSEKLLTTANWSSETREEWGVHGERFVAMIEGVAANPYLIEASRRYRDVPQLSAIRFAWLSCPVAQRLHSSHIEILLAIEQGHQSRAEALAREHIYQLGRSALNEVDG